MNVIIVMSACITLAVVVTYFAAYRWLLNGIRQAGMRDLVKMRRVTILNSPAVDGDNSDHDTRPEAVRLLLGNDDNGRMAFLLDSPPRGQAA